MGQRADTFSGVPPGSAGVTAESDKIQAFINPKLGGCTCRKLGELWLRDRECPLHGDAMRATLDEYLLGRWEEWIK